MKGKCMYCGLELTDERSLDGAYRHFHPDLKEGRFFCEFMQDELGRDSPELRGRRGSPLPEEDIVDKILNKYYEDTCK